MKSLVATLSPTDASVPLRIAEALAASFPELSRKPFVNLQIDTFQQRGLCKVTWRTNPSRAEQFSWAGLEQDGLTHDVTCGLADVAWQGEHFLLAEFQWSTNFGGERQSWLLAQDERAIDRFALEIYRTTNTPYEAVLVFSGGCWSENKRLFTSIQASSFENLVLEPHVVDEMRTEFRSFLGMRSEYEALGLPWRRGALFVGPPGNGKTQCLRALARELGLATLYVQSLKTRYDPEESMIARVFNRARQLQPALLIFEDLDALITDNNRSVFLNQMDGFERNAGLIVIGTTNHPERLDPSLLDRPSRFDRKYHFPLPSAGLRARYVETWRQKLAGRVAFSQELAAEIAAGTDGFSFAYLQELFVSALMRHAGSADRDISKSLRACLTLLRGQMQTGRSLLYPEPSGDDASGQ